MRGDHNIHSRVARRYRRWGERRDKVRRNTLPEPISESEFVRSTVNQTVLEFLPIINHVCAVCGVVG